MTEGEPASIDVQAWRKAERERLLAQRQAMPAALREQQTAVIARKLDTLLAKGSHRIVSAYWPIRAEPDLRPWMHALAARGVGVALPVAQRLGLPLSFRRWHPDAAMERGLWNIPHPAAGPDLVPDVVLAPLVGFDGAKYRLGYGGGFFDRTLATLPTKPLAIGVGYAGMRIDTIHPQVHDIPMDLIVTGEAA